MIECQFYDKGFCKFASNKAGIPIPTYDKSCQACLSGKPVIEGLITVEKFKQRTRPKYLVTVNTICCDKVDLPLISDPFEGMIEGVVCMSSDYTSMCECYYQYLNGKWEKYHNECAENRM